MLLRVRGPQGQSTLTVEPNQPVLAFCIALEQATGVPVAQQEARAGYSVLPTS